MSIRMMHYGTTKLTGRKTIPLTLVNSKYRPKLENATL